MMKKILIPVLSLVMAFSLFSPVLAHDDKGSFINGAPIKGIAPDNGYAEEPAAGEIKGNKPASEKHKQEKVKSKDGDVGTQHASIYYHEHYVDNIYNEYDGYRDRGEIASAYNDCDCKASLGFSISETVSNGWGANLGFSASAVSNGVGYNVSWSTQKTWSYSVDTNPYHTAHVGYQDWYHVDEFNGHTTYYYETGDSSTEYVQGWGEQWYKPHFYNWQTEGNTP
jgi:hypothetical protein